MQEPLLLNPRAPEGPLLWPLTDDQGNQFGTAGWLDGDPTLELPGWGRFRHRRSLGSVAAWTPPGASETRTAEACRRWAVPLFHQAVGGVTLHASAVRIPAGVIAICGRNGAGKSTLAAGLARAGFSLWADDALLLESRGEEWIVEPCPFRSRLDGGARRALRARSGTDRWIRRRGRWPLAGIVVLARSARRRGIQWRPIRSRLAFPELLAHALAFDSETARARALLASQYLRLCARVPVVRLSYPDGFGRLPEVVDEFARHFGGRAGLALTGRRQNR